MVGTPPAALCTQGGDFCRFGFVTSKNKTSIVEQADVRERGKFRESQIN